MGWQTLFLFLEAPIGRQIGNQWRHREKVASERLFAYTYVLRVYEVIKLSRMLSFVCVIP